MTAPAGPSRPLVRVFTQRFSATRRGARLARQLVLVELHDWGIPERTRVCDDAGLIVAELAANAVVHGWVPGRDFELRMTLLEGTLRIEVSDACQERRPEVAPRAYQAESGYGLRLVEPGGPGGGGRAPGRGHTVWGGRPPG
ncbi:ATP-binding protein, partial [Streptomyces goshikiensis]